MSIWLGILRSFFKLFNFSKFLPAKAQVTLFASKCVLTTVGPYQLYGEKIIRTCISSGTDYVDLCGEPGWMHKIIGECSDDAKKSGSRIIFSCGFDSIPFDLGVLFAQDETMSRYNKYASSVRGLSLIHI